MVVTSHVSSLHWMVRRLVLIQDYIYSRDPTLKPVFITGNNLANREADLEALRAHGMKKRYVVGPLPLSPRCSLGG